MCSSDLNYVPLRSVPVLALCLSRAQTGTFLKNRELRLLDSIEIKSRILHYTGRAAHSDILPAKTNPCGLFVDFSYYYGVLAENAPATRPHVQLRTGYSEIQCKKWGMLVRVLFRREFVI